MDQKLKTDRAAIDRIDRQIVELISQRIAAARQIGTTKGRDADLVIRDPKREREIFERWNATAQELGLSGYYVGRVLREILSYSRRIQEGYLSETSSGTTQPVTRVGYQGAVNSYSYLAAKKLFSHREKTALEPHSFRTFRAAVDALVAGELEYVLLPIENTIAGSLNETYELLKEYQLAIVDEEFWQVDHCLAGLPGSTINEIFTIRSHPVALQQCQMFLARTTWASTEAYYDTAVAAESLIAEGNPAVAAICSEECAHALGLDILQKSIADQPHNQTRFVLVSRSAESIDPRLPCKTSLRLALNHREGALAEILQSFAARKINLTKLESRPKPESPWEYEFYVDINGHQDDPAMADAIEEARGHTNYLRILGTYPRRGQELEQVPFTVPTASDNGNGNGRAHSPKSTAIVAPGHSSAQRNTPKRIPVHLGAVEIGGERFVVIAGPCAVENRRQMLDTAQIVRDAGARALRGGAYKPRTSHDSFQGLGWQGVELLTEAGHAYELPVVTEVLRTEDVDRVAAVVDAIQVGARNMQNYALLRKLGTIDRTVILKRGLSATIDELLKAAAYITAGGNHRVILCERGIRTFETATRSTLDVSSVPVLRERTGLPIIVDPSHAAGERHLVEPLALAAAAVGADGLLVEVHANPEAALCDGPQALTADGLQSLMSKLEPIVATHGRTL
ncbi:MAG: hypothetical protein Kow0074_22440 [Candidatus Zixiibacteriota bacterium]